MDGWWTTQDTDNNCWVTYKQQQLQKKTSELLVMNVEQEAQLCSENSASVSPGKRLLKVIQGHLFQGHYRPNVLPRQPLSLWLLTKTLYFHSPEFTPGLHFCRWKDQPRVIISLRPRWISGCILLDKKLDFWSCCSVLHEDFMALACVILIPYRVTDRRTGWLWSIQRAAWLCCADVL